jgi:hypothetical protein
MTAARVAHSLLFWEDGVMHKGSQACRTREPERLRRKIKVVCAANIQNGWPELPSRRRIPGLLHRAAGIWRAGSATAGESDCSTPRKDQHD